MSEVTLTLIILTIFFGFLASLIEMIIINPNRVDVKAKKDSDKISQEFSLSLDKDEEQKRK